jgi:pyruvyltransferase
MYRMYRPYWWHDRPNFGDTLTHSLLNARGIEHVLANPHEADLVMSGSVLEHMPSGWEGIVLGTGSLHEHSDLRIPLRKAAILAVRGPLTAKKLPRSWRDAALGDPGLLAQTIVDPQYFTWDLGVVRHWSDDKLTRRYAYGHIIDPERGAKAVITDIARCKRIVTSSLHGCIVADAFGIPRVCHPFGDRFKWDDYFASIGENHVYGTLGEANRSAVERRVRELTDAVACL